MILNDRIIDDEIIERLLLHNTIESADEILAKPKLISSVSKKYNDMPAQRLSDLFCGFSAQKNHQSAYSRLQVFTMGVLPGDPFEFTQLFCEKCVKTFSFRDVSSKTQNMEENGKQVSSDVYTCPQCTVITRPIYRMIFLMKDESTLGMDKIYKFHFYTYNGICENFFGGLKPTNLYKDSAALKQIKDYIRLMTRFNVYIDCIVRRKYSQKQNEDLFELYDGQLNELPTSVK